MGIFDRLKWLRSYTGIELYFSQGSIDCRCCTISLRSDSLTIDSKVRFSGDLADIVKKIPKDKPVAISLTGKGILIKRTSKEEELTPEKLSLLFPNLQAQEFYIQNFLSGPHSFVSIIRKEVVDSLLSTIAIAGIKCLSIGIGPFPIYHIQKQLNSYGSSLDFDGHCISLSENGDWGNYRYEDGSVSKFALKLDLEPIQEHFVLAYAASFQLALHQKVSAIALEIKAITSNLGEFEQKQKFNFRSVVIATSFFLMLLINFLLHHYYSAQNEVFQKQVNQSSTSLDNMRQLEQSVAGMEHTLKELGWNKGLNYAWLTDQIGQSAPKDVIFQEIEISPSNIELNREHREIYQSGLIKVSGFSSNLNDINEWIYTLRRQHWVRQVRLDDFSRSSNDDNQQFSLTMTLNDD